MSAGGTAAVGNLPTAEMSGLSVSADRVVIGGIRVFSLLRTKVLEEKCLSTSEICIEVLETFQVGQN